MAKTNTYTIEMDGMKFSAPTQAEALAMAQAFRSKPTSTGKGKKVDKELVEYHKNNGEVVMVTPAQAKAYDDWKARPRKTVEELKALKPQISAKGKAFVKAHPNCTRKEAAANGCVNITKEGLKALKRELGVR